MPQHRDRKLLRTTFGSVAELYDRARPEYPAEVFDDLVALAGLGPGSRVLEIGPGTGKATVDLVRRGLSVTGVELSAELAEVVRRNVPEAEIVVADFEEFEPERAGFDAVVAFSAFHWVAPELRYEKPARLLRPGGVLAVVHTHHVANDDPFWVDSQQDYDAVVPHQDNEPPPPIEDEPWLEPDAALFPTLEQRRYADERTYSPDDYVALISTYSENIALAQEQRDELLGRLHARAAAQGTVRKRLVYELTVAYLPMG